VRAGQLLAVYEPVLQQSQRSAAEADRQAARTDLTTAQWNADQSRELFRAGAIAERELRVAEQGVAAARARLSATEARIRQTSLDLADTRVVAPIAGVVESRTVEGGERVARGAELFTVVRGDVLELAGSVPERVSGDVRPGQPVRLDVGGRRVTGRVARVSPTVDPTTRGITVFVEVPNPGGALKGNTFATGRAVGRVIPDALLVPTTALRQAQAEGGGAAGTPAEQGTFVYRLRGNTAERAPVSLGLVDEAAGVAEVVDGLAPGDRVIVGNVASVGRGVTVQIIGGGERKP
jgi:RND family efflux transporter MFP subunit